MIGGRSVLGPGRVSGRVVNQFSKLKAGLGLDGSRVVLGSLASAIEASDSCLTCSHEDVAVELTDVARMIFPRSSLQCDGWPLERQHAPGARDLSFFVFCSLL